MGSDKYRAAIIITVKVNSDNLNQLPACKLRTFLLLNTGSFAFPQMTGGLTLERRSATSEGLSQSSSQLSVKTASLDIPDRLPPFPTISSTRWGMDKACQEGRGLCPDRNNPATLTRRRPDGLRQADAAGAPAEKDKSMSREAR